MNQHEHENNEYENEIDLEHKIVDARFLFEDDPGADRSFGERSP